MFEEFMQVNPSNLKIEVNSEEWQNNGWFHLQDNKENKTKYAVDMNSLK